MITATRINLKAAAGKQPGLLPIANVLDTQLRNYAKANAEDRAALKPEIEKSVRKIEAACGGR